MTKKIPYRIESLKTEQFAMFPESFKEKERIQISTKFEFQINNDRNKIKCISEFVYSHESDVLLKLVLNSIFNIADEGKENLIKEKKIPVDFLRYMATIVTGTARGVIHSKTEGTLLNKCVLPPIDLTKVIKEDYKF